MTNHSTLQDSSREIAVSPFIKVLEALRACGSEARFNGPGKARLRCPAHNDRTPSLSVTDAGDRALIKCFGGCSARAVLAAIGLTLRDLYAGPRLSGARRREVDAYNYTDTSGKLVAQKVRCEPKSFHFRRPDGDTFVNNTQGIELGLYRRADLRNRDTLFVVEGEKAVNRLLELGAAATCPPHGASVWKTDYSNEIILAGVRRVWIIPDNDNTGRHHALRVAESIWNAARERALVPVEIALCPLPAVPPGGDAYDFLETRSLGELLDLAVKAKPWSPMAVQEAREQRRRDKTRERVRRHRLAKRGRVEEAGA